MLLVKQDVGLGNEADDQSRLGHLVATVPVAVGAESENFDVDLCFAVVLPVVVTTTASDFLVLHFGTAADSKLAENVVEAEVGDLHCLFELSPID